MTEEPGVALVKAQEHQMGIRRTIETLLRDGFILVFNQDKLDVVKTAQALVQAGVNNMEVTCRIREPLEKLTRLREELPDFVAGAASLVDFPGVLDTYNRVHTDDPLPTLGQAADAGADFLVSAGNFSGESYQRFAGKVAMIPGCGTVTEILGQFSQGANLCKVFPAKQLGGPAARIRTTWVTTLKRAFWLWAARSVW